MEGDGEQWDHDLPRISSAPALARGTLKGEAGHFIVREEAAYEPEGTGDYLFIHLTREGWSTRGLRSRLSAILNVPEAEIGYAGLKDKRARVSQTFSVRREDAHSDRTAARIEQALDARVEWIRPHARPIKVGHLRGNRFQILVTDLQGEPAALLDDARRLGKALVSEGAPNYFGGQRFGREGDNARRGRRILRGERCRDPWLRDLLLSAYQSGLFNQWLGERIRRGDFHRLIRGDAALRRDERGFLDVDEPEAYSREFQAGKLDYTGPMFGAKTPRSGYGAAELDRLILQRDGMEPKRFARSGLTGGRRRGRLFARDLEIRGLPEGLEFSFFLPKGAYATVFLREFVAPGGLRETPDENSDENSDETSGAGTTEPIDREQT